MHRCGEPCAPHQLSLPLARGRYHSPPASHYAADVGPCTIVQRCRVPPCRRHAVWQTMTVTSAKPKVSDLHEPPATSPTSPRQLSSSSLLSLASHRSSPPQPSLLLLPPSLGPRSTTRDRSRMTCPHKCTRCVVQRPATKWRNGGGMHKQRSVANIVGGVAPAWCEGAALPSITTHDNA